MADFVTWGGQRVTPYMAYQLDRLNAALMAVFGVALRCVSGIRTAQEQIDIFLARYVTAGNVKGRYVYDTRWWNGTLYYRISSAGTVATPGTSNHEIQGDSAAVDIQDTGVTAGIMSADSERGKWLRANVAEYDMVAEGDSFKEGWHFKMNRIFAPVPAAPATGSDASNFTKHLQEGAMEIVMVVPNGTVVHLSGTHKFNFGSVAEYNRIRGDIEFFRARGGISAMALPPLKDVVGVDWPTYKRFCAYFGAPEN